MNVWDGKTAKTLNKLTNIVILNLLWILFSIPIVTIVPATVAMVGVVKKWHLEKEERVLKPFLQIFRMKLRQSLLIGVPWLMIGALLLFDLTVFFNIPNGFVRMALIVITSFVILLYLFTSVYLVPVMLNENNLKIKPMIKRAFALSFYDLPVSFSVVVITVSAIFVVSLFPVTIIFIGALTAMINYRFCHKTFQKVESHNMTKAHVKKHCF
jgi:uncharacterized membrane protein YesL